VVTLSAFPVEESDRPGDVVIAGPVAVCSPAALVRVI
jgi:hypothetical protein